MKRVYVTLDFACNNDCLLCANMPEERKTGYSLDTREVKNFLVDMKLKRDDIVEFSGGEPTLRKDLPEICDFIRDNLQGRTVLLTNARKLSDPEFADKISEKVDKTVTAFYSHLPEKHDYITQRRNSFQESLRGVKNMEERGIEVHVKSIPTQLNYRELPEFIDFAFEEFQDPTVFFSGMDLRGFAKTNQDKVAVKYSDIKPYIEKSMDRAEEKGRNAFIFMMPMCIIDPCYWKHYSLCMGEMSREVEFLIAGRESKKDKGLSMGRPSENCYDCALERRCFWGWKGYVEKYGNNEFGFLEVKEK